MNKTLLQHVMKIINEIDNDYEINTLTETQFTKMFVEFMYGEIGLDLETIKEEIERLIEIRDEM